MLKHIFTPPRTMAAILGRQNSNNSSHGPVPVSREWRDWCTGERTRLKGAKVQIVLPFCLGGYCKAMQTKAHASMSDA